MSAVMDYKSTLIKIFLSLFCLSLIVGCDTDVSPEPLRISGTPPEELYFDSVFEYEFGASGGDGKYRYRYIRNPENIEDRPDNFIENPVEMSIQVKDDAKASFSLLAIPKIPDGSVFDELTNQKYKYEIELTDGNNTVTKEFEFTLKKNKLNIEDIELGTEGSVSNSIAKTILNLQESGDKRICSQIRDYNYEKSTNSTGQTVYPFAFQVLTDAQVSSRTELFYRITSNYVETAPEKSSRNIGAMRKNVDYVDEVRSIVLEPNQATCVGYVEILDDTLVEGNESLTVEFFDNIGGAIDYAAARTIIEIRDNEIIPRYTTDEVVRNRGSSVVVPIRLSRPVDYPVSVNISVDAEETTAESVDYTIVPESRVITFEPGETEAAYTVNLNNIDPSAELATEDRVVTITTDIDDIVDVDPYQIEINDWATKNLSEEVIAASNNNEDVIDFAVDGDGLITTLIQSSSSSNITSVLRAINRDSSSFNFTSTGDMTLAKTGVDITPKAVELTTSTASSTHRVAVVLNVNGLYADVLRGGTDFVVMMFERARGENFNLISAKQYGSDGDDFVEGAFFRNSTLYVFGQTDGENFEGAPSSDTNNGGNDGFIYAIDVINNAYKWAKFVGTTNEDKVAAIDAGNRDVITASSSINSDKDTFISKLAQQTGLDQNNGNAAYTFSSVRDETPVAILFDSSASNYSVLVDTDANIDSENELTPSLSRDAQLLTLDSDNESVGYLSFATSQDDIAKSLVKMTDNQHLLVSGDTFGRFEENTKPGSDDSDIFIGIIDSEKISSLEIVKTLQYGTTENDNLIKVRAVSATKFFALWSEQFSSPGNTTYRISAFSIDGTKLARDPE